MSVHPRKDWKAVQLPYEKIASYSGAKKRRYELSDRTVAMLLAQTPYLHWASRWQSDTPLTEAQKRQIRQWAAQAEAELFPECESHECHDILPDDALVITYEPNDPFQTPDYTPPGYLLPPWYTNPLIPIPGVLPTDAMVNFLGLPQGYTWEFLLDLLTEGLPRFRVTFFGPAEVELHLVAIPQGGNVLITRDGDPDLNNASIVDLNRDLLSIPLGETTSEIVVEQIFETPGEHFIDVTFYPVVNDAIPPFFFGGGLRKVTICETYNCPEIVEMFDVRQNEENPCTLEKTDDGGETWTAWANLHLCPPLLRKNPQTGELEYSPDGEDWNPVPDVPGTNDPLYTNPPAPLGDNGACERASNAMAVYNYFAQELANIIDDTPGGVLQVIAGQFSRLFYDFFNAAFAGQLDAASSATALNLEILNYLTALFLDATAAGQSAGTYLRESWDGFTQEDVVCAFYCTANPDGTLNYSAAQARLLELVNADDIRPTVKALIDCFGEGGFAAAQSTSGAMERDCDECECDQLFLESEGFPGGYGTLTYLGSGRWRVVSELRGADHAVGVRRAGALCWYSSNYTFTSGSVTHQDYRLCGAGSQTVGNPVNKCITSFFMASASPFTLEFDASECP